MRIGIIAPHRHPIRQPFFGGQEAFVWRLASSLTAAGHHVVLFAPAGSDASVSAELVPFERMTLSTAAALDVTCPLADVLDEHHSYLRVVQQLSARLDLDVVHNHSLHHYPVALSELSAAPVLTTLHTPPFAWLESAAAMANGHTFTAVSAAVAAQWSTIPDVRVIPNGVDPDIFAMGSGGDDLAWVGRLVSEKAPHVAIDAAAAVGMPIDVAGPIGDPNYVATMVNPRLCDEARYVGHLSEIELPAFYGGAAATLVTPVWDEPFGLVAAESIMCGTPVVALDRGGLREIVRDGVSGYLATSIEELPGLIKLARELPRDLVRADGLERLGTSPMMRAYVSIYRQLSDRG